MTAKKSGQATKTLKQRIIARRKRFARQDRQHLPRLMTTRRLLRESWLLLRNNWKLFGGLGLLYAISHRILVDGMSQINWNAASSDVVTSNANAGDAAASVAVLTGSALDPTVAMGQISSMYSSILTIFFALAVVWAVRQAVAKHQVKIRDALYNCAAPVLSTVIMLGIIFLQLFPMVLGIFAYLISVDLGIVQSGVEKAALFVVAFLGTLLSCYWLSSSLMALVAVTLPGSYPISALKAANELVRYRRWQVLMRIAVYSLIVLIVWVVVLVGAALLPISEYLMPEIIALLRAITLVVTTVLLYKLYRSLVDES